MTLILNTGATAIDNSGTLEATLGGTLVLMSNVGNDGSIIASGGKVDVQAHAFSASAAEKIGAAGGSTTRI